MNLVDYLGVGVYGAWWVFAGCPLLGLPEARQRPKLRRHDNWVRLIRKTRA